MNNRERNLIEAVKCYNKHSDHQWQALVEAVNKYIDEGGDLYSLYPQTEREIDRPAQVTAWFILG